MNESVEVVLNNIKRGVYPEGAFAKITISNFMTKTYFVKELQVVKGYLRTEKIDFSTLASRITRIEISTCDADF